MKISEKIFFEGFTQDVQGIFLMPVERGFRGIQLGSHFPFVLTVHDEAADFPVLRREVIELFTEPADEFCVCILRFNVGIGGDGLNPLCGVAVTVLDGFVQGVRIASHLVAAVVAVHIAEKAAVSRTDTATVPLLGFPLGVDGAIVIVKGFPGGGDPDDSPFSVFFRVDLPEGDFVLLFIVLHNIGSFEFQNFEDIKGFLKSAGAEIRYKNEKTAGRYLEIGIRTVVLRSRGFL